MATNISRRTVAKGAAWSIPAVTVAAASPALAASCKAGINASGYVSYNRVFNSTQLDNNDNFKWYSAYTPSASGFGEGNCYTACAGQAVANYTLTLWLPCENVVWKVNTGDTGAWSVPKQVGAPQSSTCTGTAVQYYPYVTTFQGTIDPGTGSEACLPAMSFVSQNGFDQGYANSYFLVSGSVTIGGTPYPFETKCLHINPYS